MGAGWLLRTATTPARCHPRRHLADHRWHPGAARWRCVHFGRRRADGCGNRNGNEWHFWRLRRSHRRRGDPRTDPRNSRRHRRRRLTRRTELGAVDRRDLVDPGRTGGCALRSWRPGRHVGPQRRRPDDVDHRPGLGRAVRPDRLRPDQRLGLLLLPPLKRAETVRQSWPPARAAKLFSGNMAKQHTLDDDETSVFTVVQPASPGRAIEPPVIPVAPVVAPPAEQPMPIQYAPPMPPFAPPSVMPPLYPPYRPAPAPFGTSGRAGLAGLVL